MSERTSNDAVRTCPYCGQSYQPEAGDFHDDSREEECGGCGKKYWAYDSFSVTHYAVPSCGLNGEDHDMVVPIGSPYAFCSKCGRCEPIGG